MRTLLLVVPLVLAAPVGASRADQGYRVETRILSGARSWPETNRWIADVIGGDGTRLYSIERPVPFDFPYPTLTLAVGGSGVLLDAARGRVEFLTARGDVADVWEPFASPLPSYERIIKCSVGREAAAFLLSEPGGDRVRVVVTDLEGRVMRETAVPGSSAGEIVIAPGGSAVVASATIEGDAIGHVTRLLDEEGRAVLDLPMLFRVGDIHDESDRYVLADRYVVVGGSLKGARTEFRVDVCGGDRIVTGVRRGPERSVVVTEEIDMNGGAPFYRDPEAIVLDSGGAVRERSRLESFSSLPALISREGDDILVRVGTKTARFRGVL